MTKLAFVLALNERLSGLPKEEAHERISFYSEMIEDRMEEGLSEEEAVAAVGSVEEVAGQITAQVSSQATTQAAAEKQPKPKRELKDWQIVLLALGAPVWIPLGIAALSVLLSAWISAWSAVISLWAAFAAVAACAFALEVVGIVLTVAGKAAQGVTLIGAGLVCGGVSVFLFHGSRGLTKGVVWLTGRILRWVKNRFVRKEEA